MPNDINFFSAVICVYFAVLDMGVDGHCTAAYAPAGVSFFVVTTLYRAIGASI